MRLPLWQTRRGPPRGRVARPVVAATIDAWSHRSTRHTPTWATTADPLDRLMQRLQMSRFSFHPTLAHTRVCACFCACMGVRVKGGKGEERELFFLYILAFSPFTLVSLVSPSSYLSWGVFTRFTFHPSPHDSPRKRYARCGVPARAATIVSTSPCCSSVVISSANPFASIFIRLSSTL